MNTLEPTIRIRVDLSNPGQFFACCGLFELADRLWPGIEIRGSFPAYAIWPLDGFDGLFTGADRRFFRQRRCSATRSRG